MAPKISERYIAHSLDAAWIIALYKAVHGGDPPLGESEFVNDTTELLARGLVGHLGGASAGIPDQIVENLAKLNIQVHLKNGAEHTEVKSTAEFRKLTVTDGIRPPGFRTICVVIKGFGEFCWTIRYTVAPRPE